MKKKLVAVMMCAAMVAMLGVGCGSKSSDDSSSKSETKKTLTEDDIKDSMKGVKLKVGTTGLFGPFSYYDEDGKTLIGYDLDLINDLQDLLGFEIDGFRQWIIRLSQPHLQKTNWIWELQHFVQQMKEKKL